MCRSLTKPFVKCKILDIVSVYICAPGTVEIFALKQSPGGAPAAFSVSADKEKFCIMNVTHEETAV